MCRARQENFQRLQPPDNTKISPMEYRKGGVSTRSILDCVTARHLDFILVPIQRPVYSLHLYNIVYLIQRLSAPSPYIYKYIYKGYSKITIFLFLILYYPALFQVGLDYILNYFIPPVRVGRA